MPPIPSSIGKAVTGVTHVNTFNPQRTRTADEAASDSPPLISLVVPPPASWRPRRAGRVPATVRPAGRFIAWVHPETASERCR
eukprot:scaffold504_cov39-Prasinocladus_malaysianus.AAC.1